MAATAVVLAGTLFAARASSRTSFRKAAPTAPVAAGGSGATDDIVPTADDLPLSFATVMEPASGWARTLRTVRLAAALILVGSAVGLISITIVRAIAILWPMIFPTG